ncbi:MAG TPA: hypothetical protein VGT04_05855 [Acidobacteriaceae bacterium]|nr:hypothetical protein [Acidobacteriaceae bacterium]
MKTIVTTFFMIAMPLACLGQWETQIIQQPQYARHLDGYVGIESGGEAPAYPIPGIRVDECVDISCKQVLNSTISDKTGQFHLKPVGAKSTYYLRLTAKNYNPRFYTVKLSPNAPPKLFLEIAPGT